MRDEFPRAVADTLAKRVGNRCSNPACRKRTSGPHTEDHKALNVGVAAHIAAASPGGPRYDSSLTQEQRKGISNGIWLCQSCAKLVDNDEARYTKELLLRWKQDAEQHALLEVESTRQNEAEDDVVARVRATFVPRTCTFYADGNRGITLRNSSGHRATVREVALLAKMEDGTAIRITFFPDAEKSPKGTEITDREWVVLPAHTEAVWLAHRNPDLKQIGKITIIGGKVIVQYEPPSGAVQLLEIETVGADSTLLASMFQPYYDQLREF